MQTNSNPDQQNNKGANQMKEKEIVTRNVRHDFSTDELEQIAGTMAALNLDLEDLDAEKKAVMSSYKDKIDGKSLDLRSASRKYRDKFEMRDVECFVERDYDEAIIRYIRTDNGECVESREMTRNERQMRIEDAGRGIE